jgi:hypothetical protein
VLGDAGFDDGGFVLLLVVVEDGKAVALHHELHLLAEGDVGGFGPGEVEFFADDVGLGKRLDGEHLVGVRVFRGVGGGVFGIAAVFGLGLWDQDAPVRGGVKLGDGTDAARLSSLGRGYGCLLVRGKHDDH